MRAVHERHLSMLPQVHDLRAKPSTSGLPFRLPAWRPQPSPKPHVSALPTSLPRAAVSRLGDLELHLPEHKCGAVRCKVRCCRPWKLTV